MASVRPKPVMCSGIGWRRIRPRRPRPWRPKSGCHSRPAPRPRRSRAVRGSKPPTRSPSATKERRPAQMRVGRRIDQRGRALRSRWMARAMSSSSGCTSCGSTGSALAGEPSSMPASGLKYQSSSTPAHQVGQAGMSTPSGGAKMKAARRLGCRPSGRTPASVATASAQAPAALTTTGASKLPWPACTCHTPPSRRDAGDFGSSPTTAPPCGECRAGSPGGWRARPCRRRRVRARRPALRRGAAPAPARRPRRR